MKLKLDRIISVATLVAALVAIFLVLKRPAPVAQPRPSAAVAEQSQPASNPIQTQPVVQPSTATSSYLTTAPAASTVAQTASPAAPQPANPAASTSKTSPRVNSSDVSSALAQLLGGGGGGAANLSVDSNVGSSMPNIKDQQVTMDGDVLHGKFLTEIGGKDVWITISGHMGEKDGYATFDPTEIKVGDMDVPVSLVNPALQKKLAEEHDRLKIPNSPTQ